MPRRRWSSTVSPACARSWPPRPSKISGTPTSSTFRAATRSGRSRDCPSSRTWPLSPDQIQRYSRHFLLSQVGEKGQRKLLRSKVLLIGAGGLGSPTALYLAAAGVGTLGLMDGDTVDVTNLQRQILHTTADVGKPKVESGTRTLKALNPDINVIPLPARITVDNAMDILRDYDLVVDGSDNFETRYLVNDACYLAGKTNVHGSIFQFEGMASVFAPARAPAIAASTHRRLPRASSPPEARPASWACSQE